MHSPSPWTCRVFSNHPGAGGQLSPCVWTGWPVSDASAGAGWLYPGWLAHLSSRHSWSQTVEQSSLKLCVEALSCPHSSSAESMFVCREEEKPFRNSCLPQLLSSCFRSLTAEWTSSLKCLSFLLGSHCSLMYSCQQLWELLSCLGCSTDVDTHLPHWGLFSLWQRLWGRCDWVYVSVFSPLPSVPSVLGSLCLSVTLPFLLSAFSLSPLWALLFVSHTR